MAEASTQVNSYVFTYLKGLSDKLAKQFKKDVGEVEELPKGSPRIQDLVMDFNETQKKRKLDESYTNGATPNKKAKMNGNGKKADSDDSSDSSSDEDEAPKKATPAKKASPAKKAATPGTVFHNFFWQSNEDLLV